MTPGLVSVIVPVFDRPGPLREAVASALAQTYRPIEILIVDDGSTDDTGAVADRLAAEHPETIRVFHVANGGPGSAREVGRLAARGEFLQYLDSDDLLLPRKLELQTEALSALPDAGIAYCRCRETDANGAELPRALRPSDRALAAIFPEFLHGRWWNTITPLYRADLCRQAGSWRPLFQEEDWELDARIGALKPGLAFVNELLAEHRHHGDARLSGTALRERDRLRDRATAHLAIREHAQRAGVEAGSPELARFARELFRLARECGAAGLPAESRSLFAAARKASSSERRRKLDFRLYAVLAGVLGWTMAARLAQSFERLRGAARSRPEKPPVVDRGVSSG
jgi:hypothetical protein